MSDSADPERPGPNRLAAEDQASRREAGRRARVQAGDIALEASAYLPDPDTDIDMEECFRLVDHFMTIQIANLGELAAPSSSLADDPHLIATAIDRSGGLPPADGETSQQQLQFYQTLIEALVDLQAFVPDDEAMAVRHWDANRKRGDASAPAEPAAAVIQRIRGAQAAAIRWVRDDPSVIGDLNAIRDLEVRIGDSRLAFSAVDAYRSGQTGGFSMMVVWPISAGIGCIVGSVVFGPSLLAFVALAAAWLAAPFYGWAMGAVTSAIDQTVLTSGSRMIVPLRHLSTLLGGVLLFASPGILAFLLLALADRLSLS